MTDNAELRKLQRDLQNAGPKTMAEARGILQKGALNIKKDWQARWQGMSHLPHLARAVSYETDYTKDGAEAEIGPDKGKLQGALGNVAEFGTAKNAPRPAGMPALNAEAPRFEKALADLAERILD